MDRKQQTLITNGCIVHVEQVFEQPRENRNLRKEWGRIKMYT
jgi:hypothetical protein